LLPFSLALELDFIALSPLTPVWFSPLLLLELPLFIALFVRSVLPLLTPDVLPFRPEPLFKLLDVPLSFMLDDVPLELANAGAAAKGRAKAAARQSFVSRLLSIGISLRWKLRRDRSAARLSPTAGHRPRWSPLR
jgi:hypothetical protein